MKILIVGLACGAVLACAAAVFPYTLNDHGIGFSDAGGSISLIDDAEDNVRMASIVGPWGRGYTSGGITPYYAFTRGVAGQTANVPYLRADGTVGTLQFTGGLFVGALNGDVPAAAADEERVRAATDGLRRRGLLH